MYDIGDSIINEGQMYYVGIDHNFVMISGYLANTAENYEHPPFKVTPFG